MFSGLTVIPKCKSSPDFNSVLLLILPGLQKNYQVSKNQPFMTDIFLFKCYLWLSHFTVPLLTLYFHSFQVILYVSLKFFLLKPHLTRKSLLPKSFASDLDQTYRSLVGQIICLIFVHKLSQHRFS